MKGLYSYEARNGFICNLSFYYILKAKGPQVVTLFDRIPFSGRAEDGLLLDDGDGTLPVGAIVETVARCLDDVG